MADEDRASQLLEALARAAEAGELPAGLSILLQEIERLRNESSVDDAETRRKQIEAAASAIVSAHGSRDMAARMVDGGLLSRQILAEVDRLLSRQNRGADAGGT